MSEVRCRFAPAQSGAIHVGNARTALYSWLTAKHHGGSFGLRAEDTDASRVSEEAFHLVMDSFDYVRMPEYRWGIFLAQPEDGRTSASVTTSAGRSARRCRGSTGISCAG